MLAVFIPETLLFLELLWHLLMGVCLHFDPVSPDPASFYLSGRVQYVLWCFFFLQLWLRCLRRNGMSCTVQCSLLYGSIIHAE